MKTNDTTIAVLALLAAALPAAGLAAGFDCLLEPSQVVEVRSPVDGLVAAVNVKRGDLVRKGQVLVELQSATERAAVDGARYRAAMEGQIASARNRVEYATLKLKRLDAMQKENFASAQARDEAQAELRLAESEQTVALENRELARIDLRRAVEQLALRTMVAPFNGVVLDRMLNPGDLAESGAGRKPALKIAQVDPMKVDVVLPAALHATVRLGARAVVDARGVSGQHVATVVAVDRVVDAASGTFVARLDLPNPKLAVLGGVRCSAEIAGVPAAPDTAPRPAAARLAP